MPLTGSMIALIGGVIWLYTYQAATACSTALLGAFAARQCSPWRFRHMLGMLALAGQVRRLSWLLPLAPDRVQHA